MCSAPAGAHLGHLPTRRPPRGVSAPGLRCDQAVPHQDPVHGHPLGHLARAAGAAQLAAPALAPVRVFDHGPAAPLPHLMVNQHGTALFRRVATLAVTMLAVDMERTRKSGDPIDAWRRSANLASPLAWPRLSEEESEMTERISLEGKVALVMAGGPISTPIPCHGASTGFNPSDTLEEPTRLSEFEHPLPAGHCGQSDLAVTFRILPQPRSPRDPCNRAQTRRPGGF